VLETPVASSKKSVLGILDRIQPLQSLRHTIDLAKKQQRPGDIINAATAQAKLVGLFKHRIETTVTIDESQSPEQMIRTIAQECGPEAAQRFARALGLITVNHPTDSD